MTEIQGIPNQTDAYWDAMPSEVRLVLRRKLRSMGGLPFIKCVGQHFKDGAWSITPFPDGGGGFGRLGLREAAGITNKLGAWRG